jgi:hypothetical protein
VCVPIVRLVHCLRRSCVGTTGDVRVCVCVCVCVCVRLLGVIIFCVCRLYVYRLRMCNPVIILNGDIGIVKLGTVGGRCMVGHRQGLAGDQSTCCRLPHTFNVSYKRES